MGRNKAAKAASRRAESAAGAPRVQDDETLGSLLQPGLRPRYHDTPRLLASGIVMGWLPGQGNEPEDLEIDQLCKSRQSKEIRRNDEFAGSPLHKDKRPLYNWVAESIHPGKYTVNPDHMKPCPPYSDNRCDICGHGENLYVFRCWPKKCNRSAQAQGQLCFERVLGYFSKTCGAALLGRPSENMKIQEKAQELLLLDPDKMQEEIESLEWTATQNASLQQAILRYSGQSAGIRNPELSAVEAIYGQLPKPEDPFRAIRRCLGFGVQHRDLAACLLPNDCLQERTSIKHVSPSVPITGLRDAVTGFGMLQLRILECCLQRRGRASLVLHCGVEQLSATRLSCL
ncbi:ABCC1 [Symbiodinium pilosum]|uniref:ABCC1 protein n=1 Tax=Symbiodinium pilosum TaxID=2952 RepID=A0A812NT28_SYMPI|nr:ABCC1 [Symbiodinium pilosum]